MIRRRQDEYAELQQRWLDQVRRIVLHHLGRLPVDVYLFGSRARGDHRVTSDFDVAVDSKNALPAHALSGLRDALEECSVPVNCDVVDLNAANDALRQRVQMEGQRWLTAKPN